MDCEFIPPQPEFTSMERLRARLLAGVTSLDAVYDFEEACNEAAKQIGVNNPNYESLVEALYQDLAKASFDFENALLLADSRDFHLWRVKLCSPSPVCPVCGTTQVQLVEWVELPVQWRCRECGHRWQTNLEMPNEDRDRDS